MVATNYFSFTRSEPLIPIRPTPTVAKAQAEQKKEQDSLKASVGTVLMGMLQFMCNGC